MKLKEKFIVLWKRLRGADESKKTCLILITLSAIALIAFVLTTLSASFIPVHIMIISMVTVFLVCGTLYFLMIYRRTHRGIKIFAEVMCGVMIVVLMVAIFYIHATANFFSKIQVPDTEKIEYSVLVRKDETKLKGLGYIASKTVGLYKDDNARKVREYLKPKIIDNAGGDFGLKMVEESSLYDLAEQFLKGENNLSVLCLSQAQIQILSDKINGFNEQVKSIYNFQLDVSTYSAGKIGEVSNDKPFILYLSLTNQFDLLNSVERVKKARSDYDDNLRKFRQDLPSDTHGYSEINQLLVVNPETNKILILNLPADYYVQLDKAGENKDTLSNTGLTGISDGIAGLEQLFGARIQYYLKATFNDLVSLAYEVGLEDVDLDSEVQKNEILDMISNRLTESDILFRNYSPILMVAGNTFQTDMPVGLISEMVKQQIATHAQWDVEEYDLEGTVEEQPLHILGNNAIESRVLVPDEKSVEVAKEKIQAIMDER